MSRIAGVVVALATTAAVLTGSTTVATPSPSAAAAPTALPREVPGGVELTMADGDLLRIWASDHHRVVWSKRRDAATGAWGPRTEVLRRTNLFCGDVDARTANGAVAAIALCDRHGYADDRAPTSSRALWSPDAVAWSSYELEGEAYEEPGISPGGARAVYPESQGYVTLGPEGFIRHRLETPGREYTATATITDEAQVSYLYGAYSGGRCPLVVLTRTGDAAPTRQEVPVDGGCQDVGLANVDSDMAWFGDASDPAHRTVVSRPDSASPWSVTGIAPAGAPGLVEVRRGLDTRFFTAPGAPLVAIGSPTGRRVQAQVFDPVTQAWGPASTVLSPGTRCRWEHFDVGGRLAVLVAIVQCGGDNVVLTTRDGLTWRTLRMGQRTIGLSPDATYVAVPGATQTHVISPELGVVSLPGASTRRCDVAIPDGPRAAVQVVARPGTRRWPTVLRRVTESGTTQLGRFPSPTPGRCRRADLSFDRPVRFVMQSTTTDRGHTMRVVRRADRWKVRYEPW